MRWQHWRLWWTVTLYIYSVTHDRILESSLGYYINPLISVLLGVVLLRERLEPLMKAAALVAAAGVVWLAIGLGRLPWISLVLAFSFGLYGLLRKIAPVGALIGLTVETLLLAPLAAGYLVGQRPAVVRHSCPAGGVSTSSSCWPDP